MIRRIIIEAVPKLRPPYEEDGLGDWFVNPDGDLDIRAVGTDLDDDTTFLVALHELIEAKLCRKAGITQNAVDAFDAAFSGEGEPGDAPDSPYREQHRRACLVEFLVADMLGHPDYGTMA